jgi:hypothetical protein
MVVVKLQPSCIQFSIDQEFKVLYQSDRRAGAQIVDRRSNLNACNSWCGNGIVVAYIHTRVPI